MINANIRIIVNAVLGKIFKKIEDETHTAIGFNEELTKLHKKDFWELGYELCDLDRNDFDLTDKEYAEDYFAEEVKKTVAYHFKDWKMLP